jgi:hypothetical protein
VVYHFVRVACILHIRHSGSSVVSPSSGLNASSKLIRILRHLPALMAFVYGCVGATTQTPRPFVVFTLATDDT